MREFDRLVGIMKRLRGPAGCPWDAQQTCQSLRQYLLEEVYEVLEAVDEEDWERLGGELGDLLLQVVFYAQIASEEGRFDMAEVCRKISDKLEYRHPHVFGQTTVRDADEVLVNWEQLKQQESEHQQRESALDGVPPALPALQQALKLQKKAAKAGFDWPEASGALAKVGEEAAEVMAAEGDAEVQAELGDLLFSLVNCARFRRVDPEVALREANSRFSRRFRQMESAAASGDRPLREMSLAEMDELWEQAKAVEESGETG